MFFGRSMARKSRDSLALCIAAVLSSGVMNTVYAGEGTPFSLQTVPLYAPGFPGAQRTFEQQWRDTAPGKNRFPTYPCKET